MPIDFQGVCPLLQVFDMPTALRFYRDVLGFEVIQAPPGAHDDRFGWVLLTFKGTEIMLNTAYEDDQRPPQPDPARIAAHGDTCLYFGCEDVDGAYQYLRTRGVNVREPNVAPYGMKQLYVTDPDGFGLCFQWPVTQQAYDVWVERYGMEAKAIG
jgi:glyoxylase I family protein